MRHGFRARGDPSGEREAAGLTGGSGQVITPKAIFGLDSESKLMEPESIHPSFTLEEVLSTVAVEPIVPDHVPTTEPPTPEQVRLIREEIDPEGMYAG
jgi:glutaconate CoA-transferase subunit B